MPARPPHTAFATSLLLLLLLSNISVLLAEPPSIFKIFRPKQSLSDESLELKVEHGPWMILAYTIPGADAKAKAVALAKEIRSDLNLPSFVMEKTTGVATTLAKRERIRNDRNGNPVPYDLELRYANGGEESVFVVLAGEFTSNEDPRIKDSLAAIRSAHPKTLATGNTKTAEADTKNGLVQKTREMIWSRTDRKDDLGPMGASFLTRNPLLPDDYFEAPKVDEFVANLNKNVEHSLLECPGKFTVQVASFTGRQVTDFGGVSQASKLKETTDALDRAALSAHELTTALRKEGEEAYEFHDRFGSYVMIGSFDSLGQELSSGQFQYNPAMVQVIAKRCGYEVVEARDPTTGAVGKTTSLKSLNKIPFDAEGKPMAVPRASTSKLYPGALLGGK